MLRQVLSFFSMLAIGVMSAAAIVAIMPWLSGRAPGGQGASLSALHFESLLLGVVLGLAISAFGHYDWAEIPRRMVAWVLVREKQFYYYTLIGGCIFVLLFY